MTMTTGADPALHLGFQSRVNLRDARLFHFSHPAGHVLPEHRHEAPAICVLLEGSYVQRYPGGEFECRGGEMVVVPPGDRHMEVVGSRGSRAAIFLLPAGVDGSFQPLDGRHLEQWGHFQGGWVRGAARRIEDELGVPDGVTALALESILLELLVRSTRHGGWPRTGAPPPWLVRARQMVLDRFTEDLTLDEVAGESGVSRSHLARAFRRWFGLSVGELVRLRRLEQAARLLLTTRSPISMVALEAGFYDQSHLGRAFRRHFGTTPAEYRRSAG